MTRWRATVKAQIGAFALDVDVRGPDGVLALIGPNGSGKTTLLRTLAGAVTTQHAEIEFGQHVVASTSRDVDVAIEHRRVGYVPQGYGLFGHLDVLDNVSFGLCTGPASIPRAQRRERAQAMLKTLGSEQLSERGVLGLSGGEQQRVALARALIIEPSIVLLDEPLAALDPATRRSVRQTLVEQLDHLGCPSVVVTHDVRDVAALAQHVCVMEHGRVVRSASLDELRAEPQTEFVREFVDAR